MYTEKKGKQEEKRNSIDSQALPLGENIPEIMSPVYEEMRRYPGEKEKEEWG